MRSMRDILTRQEESRAEMRSLHEAAGPDGNFAAEQQARWSELETEATGLQTRQQRQATLDDAERRMQGQQLAGTGTVERAIRPLVLSRKNALFASGGDGGARWADVASLVETCKLNNVNPQRYLTDLLTRLVNGWSNSRIDELMPWCWTTADSR
jgi:hypothetical protein